MTTEAEIDAVETSVTSDALEPQETKMEEEATTMTTTVPTVEQINVDVKLENVENDTEQVLPSAEVIPQSNNTETQVQTESLTVAENQFDSAASCTKSRSRPSSREQSPQVEGDGKLDRSPEESKNLTDSEQRTVATDCSESRDSNSFSENKNN